ncbi:MAG: ECF transporter S component [Spirochaetales bacterium]|nr:ECF transporter S component [Spirochaetales bacterium]MDD7008330.1 ECF transporter S component [Spirochaetales bacterium]MDY2815394.1 ECF transporter S component [Bullifex sp.]
MSTIKKTVIAAVCVALCTVFPMAFHAIPKAGLIYTPMHIPVLLCGLITGPVTGFICGLAGPLISSLLTGMPASAMLPSMMAELAVYGLVTGLMCSFVKFTKPSVTVYVALVTALIAGRVVGGLLKALIFSAGSYSLSVWFTSYFVTCLPGIIIQLIFVPAVMIALEKARLIPPLESR